MFKTFCKIRHSTLIQHVNIRQFSNKYVNNRPNYGYWAAACTGLSGIIYLSMQGRKLSYQNQRNSHTNQQMSQFDPIVQSRLKQAIIYLGSGIGITGFVVGSLRNSRLIYVNPLPLFVVSLISIYSNQSINYYKSPILKHMAWLCCIGSMSLCILPIINAIQMPIVYDAMFAAGIITIGLSTVAYNSPREQFLKWKGVLSICLASLIAVSLLNIYWPSRLLNSIDLYGGLILFSGFILYDTQKLIHNAKTRQYWDPINESLNIYIDAIVLFGEILSILTNNNTK